MYPVISLIILHVLGASAVPAPGSSHAHDHDIAQSLPSKTWYQHPDHPVHALFRRDAVGDGTAYASVGSPSWSAAYPSNTPNPSALPTEWVNALNAAVQAGKIPNIPQSSNLPNQNPVYPTGYDPNSATVCSATEKCVTPGDIWDAPDGVFASSFDDGPTLSTPTLVNFLQSNNKTTTHFMIGVNILNNPTQFLTAFNAGHDIAVHTWTHPYMTTLSNMDLLGQFGWTMQIIHNSTGGRVPKFWRPPYGDSDLRVRAIAKEVFGLTTVVWNHDTEDWAQTTVPPIQTAMSTFLKDPKHPGVIILEHELTDITVNGFIQSYPLIQQNGWNFVSLAQAVGNGSSYENAQSSTSNVTPMGILLSDMTTSTSSTPAPTTSATPAVSAPQTSGTSGQNLSNGAKTQTSSSTTLRYVLSGHGTHSALVLAAVIGGIVMCI